MVGSEQAPELGAVVVGTGYGCLTHVPALRAAGFQLRALVGRDPERTAARAERLAIPGALTSLTEALSLPGVDAVSIATPPATHASLALEAIAAHKHVLVEKPFARDRAEALELLAAAEGAGVIHLLGTEFRFATAQAHMTRAIAEGAVGQARLATFLLHIPLLADPGAEVPEWWADARQGGGWLGAHAAHVIDQIQSTLGPFEGVSAGLPVPVGRTWTAEDSYIVHFRLCSGVEGVMQSTAGDWGPLVMMTRIVGSRGSLWTEGDALWVADQAGARQLPVPEDLRLGRSQPPPSELLRTAYDLLHSTGVDLAPYTRLAGAFRDRILGRPVAAGPAPATFADGVATMAVIDAIRRAASERTWVAVEGG